MHPLLPIMRDGLDPHGELVRLRREWPVAAFPMLGLRKAWLVTRYADVRAVLGDAGTFGNDLGLSRDGQKMVGQWRPGGLGFHDAPAHTRRRRLLAPAFRARAVRAMAPRIEAIVAARLDHMAQARQPVDLVRVLAEPVAAGVIGELVGIQDSRPSGRFEFSGDLGTSVAAIDRSVDRIAEVVRRQRAGRRTGLLGRLISEHGDHITDEELVGLVDGVLTGGLDTTASMIATGCLVLLTNDHLAACTGDSRLVDELLRHVCVAQLAFPRFARHDVTLRGQRIEAGDTVFCSLPTANRDPALGAGMDDVDPRRDRPPHLAFGFGVHRCLGAPLARLEMRIVFSALLRRFPGLRLAVPAERVEFKRFSVIHGVESLPVTW